MSPELSRPRPRLLVYVQVLRRQKWWVALVTMLGIVGALLYTLSQSTVYTATTLVNVTLPASLGQSAPNNTISAQQLSSDARLVTTGPVEKAAEVALGHVGAAVTASASSSDTLLAIRATDSSPIVAADTANTFAKAFVSYEDHLTANIGAKAAAVLSTQLSSISSHETALRNSLPSAQGSGSAQTQAIQQEINYLLGEESTLLQQRSQVLVTAQLSTGEFALAAQAAPPTRPSAPNPGRDVPLGGLAGLLVGLVAAAGVDVLDDSLRTRADVGRELPGVPVLGLIPFIGSRKRPRLVSLSAPDSPAAESFRGVRNALQSGRSDRQNRMILVTSASPGEGKSTTVANLGVALARTGQEVCVLSADLRKPRLGNLFSLPLEPGFTSVALGKTSLDGALTEVADVPGLWYLGSGPLPAQPGDFLSSRQAAGLFATLRARFDIVLLDSPPLSAVADSTTLASYSDGVLLVIRQGATRRGRLSSVAVQMTQAGSDIIGCILCEGSPRGFRQSGETFGLYAGDRQRRARGLFQEPRHAERATSALHRSQQGATT